MPARRSSTFDARLFRQGVRSLIYGLLIIGVVAETYPIFFLFLNTMKTDTQILNEPFALPTQFSFDAVQYVWSGERTGMPFGVFFRNSAVITLGTIVLLLAVSCLGGYALARGQFPGRTLLPQALLVTLAIPAQALAIPIYFFLGTLGLRDNLLGLTLVYASLGTPFTTILMRAYFMSFPRELEDAARLDGCSSLGVFARIVLPISRGPLAGMAIININWIWSELFFAVILMNTSDSRTLPVAIALYQPAQMTAERVLQLQYTVLALATLPVLLLFFFFQGQIAKGMTMGAIK